MIPRIIHYCWFGTKPFGELESACFDSWQSVLTDFQFRLWNEESLDLDNYSFAKSAYIAGKYAFVSDVVRLHALYLEGGIYLDTDMLVLKDFDSLLQHDFFIGEYRSGALNAAIIGASLGHPLLCKLLDFYQDLEFDFLKPKTIPEIFDEVIWNNFDQTVKIYPPEVFYPLPLENKESDHISYLSKNSIAVHLWNHSWKDEFVLMRENRFWDSVTLAINHFYSYPETYRNKEYIKRFQIFFWRNLKRYLKAKFSEKA